MSGVATYRCTDTAPGTSAVPITSTLVNCEVTAKARGYKWDARQSLANMKLELWRPFVLPQDRVPTGSGVLEATDAAGVVQAETAEER